MQTEIFPKKEDPAELARLESALSNGKWMSAKRLFIYTGLNDREVRYLAQASDGRIITGNKGYKLIRHASVIEVNECCDRLRSQASRMIGRVIQIQRRYHARRPDAARI
jgi:hypothetical protein